MSEQSDDEDRLISTTVYIRESNLTHLKEYSKKTSIPMSVYIREAISDWLVKRGLILEQESFPEEHLGRRTN